MLMCTMDLSCVLMLSTVDGFVNRCTLSNHWRDPDRGIVFVNTFCVYYASHMILHLVMRCSGNGMNLRKSILKSIPFTGLCTKCVSESML